MDVDFIFRIAAIGIIVTVLNLVLVRSGREDQALLTTLAGLVVVLLMVVNAIADLFSAVKGFSGYSYGNFQNTCGLRYYRRFIAYAETAKRRIRAFNIACRWDNGNGLHS